MGFAFPSLQHSSEIIWITDQLEYFHIYVFKEIQQLSNSEPLYSLNPL